MKNILIKKKTFEFAVRIVRLNIFLRGSKKEYVLSKQILRSGTSIGANIEGQPVLHQKQILNTNYLLLTKRHEKLTTGSNSCRELTLSIVKCSNF